MCAETAGFYALSPSPPPLLPSLFPVVCFLEVGSGEVLRGRIVLIFSTSCLANNVEGTVVHISAGRHLKGRQSGAGAICIKPPGPCLWSG